MSLLRFIVHGVNSWNISSSRYFLWLLEIIFCASNLDILLPFSQDGDKRLLAFTKRGLSTHSVSAHVYLPLFFLFFFNEE